MAGVRQEAKDASPMSNKEYEKRRSALYKSMMQFAQDAASAFPPFKAVTKEGFIPLDRERTDWRACGFPEFLKLFFHREVGFGKRFPVIWTQFEEDGRVSLFLGTDSTGRGLLQDGIRISASPTTIDLAMTTSYFQSGPSPIATEQQGLREYIGPWGNNKGQVIKLANLIVDFAQTQAVSAQKVDKPLSVV
jgi:hypothetical protein